MNYTVRYAHLKEKSNLVIGEPVRAGDKLAIMGNTGFSTGPHLHIDCVKGIQDKIYHLSDMENGIIEPAPRQLNYFIDEDLFKAQFAITTVYNELQYFRKYGKIHSGYDVVGVGDGSIYWNRSHTGTVVYNDFDKGYGNCLMIRFLVEE